MKSKPLIFLYTLLLIFFSTLRPSAAQRISAVDLSALQDIRNGLTEIPSTDFFNSWDFDSPADACSAFSGVTCSESPSSEIPRRVTALNLGSGLSDSPRLAGTLSPSIGNLSELTQLVLFSGVVTGQIPPEIGSLTNLRVLSLANNRLTGEIPAEIFTLPNLHTLDLSHNQLAGEIAGVERLTELRVMILAGNQISGELTALPAQLLHLDLSENNISGMLPNHVPSSLRYLSVSSNQMVGPLSNGLTENLADLVYLDVSMNRFSGPIPSTLFRSSLPQLFLQRNNFSGRVKILHLDLDRIGYGSGSILDLSHNSIAGEIPAGLATAESLFLNNNRFSGAVPPAYFDSVYAGVTKTLYLQHNFITDFPPENAAALPDSVTICLTYNCAVPRLPPGSMTCPASAGDQLSRPASQCSSFNNGGKLG